MQGWELPDTRQRHWSKVRIFFEVYTSSVSFGSLLFYFFVLTKFKMKPFCFCTYQIGYSLNLYSQKLVLRMFSLVVFEVTLFSCFSPLNGMITRAEIESANKTSFIVGLAEGMPYISLHRIIYPDPARQIYIKRKIFCKTQYVSCFRQDCPNI